MIHKAEKPTHRNALKVLEEMCHQNSNMFSLKKKNFFLETGLHRI